MYTCTTNAFHSECYFNCFGIYDTVENLIHLIKTNNSNVSSATVERKDTHLEVLTQQQYGGSCYEIYGLTEEEIAAVSTADYDTCTLERLSE